MARLFVGFATFGLHYQTFERYRKHLKGEEAKKLQGTATTPYILRVSPNLPKFRAMLKYLLQTEKDSEGAGRIIQNLKLGPN